MKEVCKSRCKMLKSSADMLKLIWTWMSSLLMLLTVYSVWVKLCIRVVWLDCRFVCKKKRKEKWDIFAFKFVNYLFELGRSSEFKKHVLIILKHAFGTQKFFWEVIYIYTVSHRSEYTPHIFFFIFYYIFSCDNTEEMTLCYNVK